MHPLSEADLVRYARHAILDEMGEEGQARLLAARVLVVGAGGLGSALTLYLAAAGVGTLGIVDDDTVDLTNLQRQIAHATAGIGRPKAESAAEAALRINPEVRVEARRLRLDGESAPGLVSRYDLVADGTDNPEARYLLAEACFAARVPLVSAAVIRFEGQLTTFRPWQEGDHPCYRCLYPEAAPAEAVPRCEQAGVLGPVAGVMGTLQAVEVVKEIAGLGDGLSGRLLLYDALGPTFRTVRFRRVPGCALCGGDGG